MAPRLKVTLRTPNNGNVVGQFPKLTVSKLGPVGFKSMPVVPSPGQIPNPRGWGSREIEMKTKQA